MKILFKTTIKREKGKLYFCKSGDDGFICLYEADAGRKKEIIGGSLK